MWLFGFIGVGTVVNPPLEKSSTTAHDHLDDGFNHNTFAFLRKVAEVVKVRLDNIVERDVAWMMDKLTSPSSKDDIIFCQNDGILMMTIMILVGMRIHCHAKI